jgi:hypothetical protein
MTDPSPSTSPAAAPEPGTYRLDPAPVITAAAAHPVIRATAVVPGAKVPSPARA